MILSSHQTASTSPLPTTTLTSKLKIIAMLTSSLLLLAAALPAFAQVEITKSINLRNSKLCLDNKDGNQSDGNRLQVAGCDRSPDQQWNWVPIQSEGNTQLYNIKLDGTDKCLAFKVPGRFSSTVLRGEAR